MQELFTEEARSKIAFVGDTLAPLYLLDPAFKQGQNLLAAFESLDAREASVEWPFVQEAREGENGTTLREIVHDALCRMQEGITLGTESLSEEYRRLFIGPQAKQAPPWGSVYTDRDGVIFGASSLDLQDWMGFNGIKRLAEDSMPDDHAGTMLLLMSWIALHRPELLEEFLCGHLLTWIPHFCQRVASVSKHPFYQGLAELTEASLQGISRATKLEVKEPRFYR